MSHFQPNTATSNKFDLGVLTLLALTVLANNKPTFNDFLISGIQKISHQFEINDNYLYFPEISSWERMGWVFSLKNDALDRVKLTKNILVDLILK